MPVRIAGGGDLSIVIPGTEGAGPPLSSPGDFPSLTYSMETFTPSLSTLQFSPSEGASPQLAAEQKPKKLKS